MIPLALLALAQPELNCQDAAPPHNPHLHYRQRTKGWVGGGPHDCSYFHADPFACDTLRWADESDREEWEWDVATSSLVLREWLPRGRRARRPRLRRLRVLPEREEEEGGRGGARRGLAEVRGGGAVMRGGGYGSG